MDYEPLQRALTGLKPEIIVTQNEKVLGLKDLISMNGDNLVSECKISMRGDHVEMWRREITDGSILERPTERYGLSISWRGVYSIPSIISPELKTLHALDCLLQVYNTSKAYNEFEKCWVV